MGFEPETPHARCECIEIHPHLIKNSFVRRAEGVREAEARVARCRLAPKAKVGVARA